MYKTFITLIEVTLIPDYVSFREKAIGYQPITDIKTQMSAL